MKNSKTAVRAEITKKIANLEAHIAWIDINGDTAGNRKVYLAQLLMMVDLLETL